MNVVKKRSVITLLYLITLKSVNKLEFLAVFWNNFYMIKIGVDIEDIERFENKPQEFLDKVFTKSEQEYCSSFSKPKSRYAARYCAKEAVVKALSGFGIKDVFYKDIEVYHDENKCPNVRLLKNTNRNLVINLSISHDKTKAVAFVTIEEQ